MLPSSGRVKLNRVALKDVITPPLAPGRRRSSRYRKTADLPGAPQTPQHGQLLSVRDAPLLAQPDTQQQTTPHIGTEASRKAPAGDAEDTTSASLPKMGNGGTEMEKRLRGGVDSGVRPGTRDVHRKGNAPPKLAGLAGSERSLRRAVKVPNSGLCCDCKHITSERKKLSNQGPKTSPGPEQPSIEDQGSPSKCKTKKANASIQTPPKKITIWMGKYPKVQLCDMAHMCDACRQDCGYVLPDVLKVVHCFKQDLNNGMRIGPSCSGCDKQGSEELAYNSVQPEKNSFKSQSLTKHKKKHLKQYTTCPSLKGRPSQAPANCSASFLLGKRTRRKECRTGMLDRVIEEDPGAGSDLIATKRRGVKKIKLWDSIRDMILPHNPAVESIIHSEPVKTDSGIKEEVESGMSAGSQSCLNAGVGSSNTFNTSVKKNISDKKPGGHKDDPRNDDVAQKSSELFSQKNTAQLELLSQQNTEQLELFSQKNTEQLELFSQKNTEQLELFSQKNTEQLELFSQKNTEQLELLSQENEVGHNNTEQLELLSQENEVGHNNTEQLELFSQKNTEQLELFSQKNTEQLELLSQENTEQLELFSQKNTEQLELLSQENTEQLELLSQENTEQLELLSQENTEQLELFSQKNTEQLELFSQENEVGHNNTEQLELFSCQRARVYFKQMRFSCARTYISYPLPNKGLTPITSAGTEAHSTKPVHASPREDVDTPVKNQDPPDSLSERPNVMFSNAARDSPPGTNHQVSPLINNEQGEDDLRQRREEKGEQIVAEKNGEEGGGQITYSLDSISIEFASEFPETEEPLANLTSEMATIPSSAREQRDHGVDIVSTPFPPCDGSETDNHLSSPSPHPTSASSSCKMAPLSSSPLLSCKLDDLDAVSATTPFITPFLPLNNVDSLHAPSSSPEHMVEGMKNVFHEETQRASSLFTSRCTLPPSSDFLHSCEALIRSQEELETEEQIRTGWGTPKPEQHYNQSPFNDDLAAVKEKKRKRRKESSLNSPTEQWPGIHINVHKAPRLSPVGSPQRLSVTNLHQVQSYSDDGGGSEEDKELPRDQIPQMASLASGLREPQSSPSNNEDLGDCNEEDREDVERGNIKLEQVSSHPRIKATLTTGLLTEPNSSPSSDEDDSGSCNDEGQPSREARTSPSEISASEESETEAAQQFVFDEFTAYEQDILLVNVIEDDSDLFGNLPRSLKLSPTTILETSGTETIGEVKTLSPRTGISLLETEQSSTTVAAEFSSVEPNCRLPIHIKEEERNSNYWRPQCIDTPSQMHGNTWPPTDKHTKATDQPDANNNHVKEASERYMVIQTRNTPHNTISPLTTMDVANGPAIKPPANMTGFRCQKSFTYCRYYFSETMNCPSKECRFRHVPIEGDEKFCVETVIRFTKNPGCLKKAGAVFISYYQSNLPGVYFSMPMLMSLLWALFKANLISDVISVLSVSMTHNIMPGPEFVLALFNSVREKGLVDFLPDLLHLTSKMTRAGLVLSLDDTVPTDQFQQTTHPNSSTPRSGNHRSSLSVSTRFPETLSLDSAILEIELCTKQMDWRKMGVVFRSICQSKHVLSDLERISGRVAVALLSETKDKLSLPFATFSEIVCQNEEEGSLIHCYLGRIGVTLMLRYHKTRQWVKGRRVVEVMSRSKVSYPMLKGLVGNEDRASRCHLVTIATELLLFSGSVEGALNTLRDNEWFLSSCLWPCDPGDLEKRSSVLMRLAEKTSHRDTLEILSNLPGLKEMSDVVHTSQYTPVFNAHLQLCVDRHTLTVASDTVDFMLSKNLPVDHDLLHILIHKLGKQNLWLRAREVFKHFHSAGYYSDVCAPPGSLSLTIPCQLGEIEMALSLEMFITVNGPAICNLKGVKPCLSITLKRTHNCEREYLFGGNRLISAAAIPRPRLSIHFTPVISSKEQVFILDTSLALRWCRSNHQWAKQMWTHT